MVKQVYSVRLEDKDFNNLVREAAGLEVNLSRLVRHKLRRKALKSMLVRDID